MASARFASQLLHAHPVKTPLSPELFSPRAFEHVAQPFSGLGRGAGLGLTLDLTAENLRAHELSSQSSQSTLASDVTATPKAGTPYPHFESFVRKPAGGTPFPRQATGRAVEFDCPSPSTRETALKFKVKGTPYPVDASSYFDLSPAASPRKKGASTPYPQESRPAAALSLRLVLLEEAQARLTHENNPRKAPGTPYPIEPSSYFGSPASCASSPRFASQFSRLRFA